MEAVAHRSQRIEATLLDLSVPFESSREVVRHRVQSRNSCPPSLAKAPDRRIPRSMTEERSAIRVPQAPRLQVMRALVACSSIALLAWAMLPPLH